MQHNKMWFSCCGSVAILILNLSMSDSANPIVTIEDGQLRGTTGLNIDGEPFLQFLGIPYAQPPINELRFKPPQPAKAWEGVRDATKAGNSSLAADAFVGPLKSSEDCLFLNVYTKKLTADGSKLRPVMVFIHGGALTMGSGRPEMHGPQYFMSKDIVLVVINYRLGALGFLSVTGTDVTGNMGLKDQSLALKWVQRNIKKFNGDPNNVTIFGISAGSSSVHGHVLSPASKGLFHRAILQSGSTLSPWFWGSKNNARKLVEQLGKTASTEREALDILKQASGTDILQAQLKLFDVLYSGFQRPFGAVIEDPNETAFFTKHPREIMKEGDYNKVPMILGFTDTEGMLMDMLEMIQPQTPKYETQNVVPYELDAPKGSARSQEIIGILEKLYPDSKKGHYDAFTDSAFLAGIAESVLSHLSTSTKPIYFYRMSVTTQINGIIVLQKRDEPGVSHGDDMGYFWPTPASPELKPGSPEERAVRVFLELWTNFAEFGDPTPKAAANTLHITWPPVEDKNRLIVLDIGRELEVKPLPEQKRVQVWLEIYEEWEKQQHPVITIEDGQLRGATGLNLDGEKFLKFLGIPYGQPPIGDLRFKPPQPIRPWEGVRDATQVGNPSLSKDVMGTHYIGAEDCLFLNVYTKRLETAKLRPVMLFIHGGAFAIGSSDPQMYGPEFLLTKDVVVVTINYRLGALGFLSISGTDVTGNMGLKDQVLALKWVQRNIKRFNGDPDNVTIFGGSAGGASVHALILSAVAKGLFHRAILQSGCTLNPWFWGSKNNARDLLARVGKTAGSELEALEILKQIPGDDIVRAQNQIFSTLYSAFNRPFGPVIEDQNQEAFLIKEPRQIIEEGHYNQVPMMMGFTDTEGMIVDLMAQFDSQSPPFEIENVIPFELEAPKGSEENKRITAILQNLYAQSKNSRYDAFTDSSFLAGIAEALISHLNTSKTPIYFYRVSISTQFNLLKRMLRKLNEPGACHGDEMGYLWRSLLAPDTPGKLEDNAIRVFVELWTNFAETGNPTPNSVANTLNVSWPPVQSKDNLTVLDIGEQLEVKKLPEHKRMQVWLDIYRQWEQQRHPIVTVQEGKLRGITGKNLDGGRILKFFGIPYAQPPIGELRFKPPQPVKPWQGLRDAIEPGSACISRDDFNGQIVGSEDCLHLNVYTRNLPNPGSKLRPVMVYIHGGGLKVGSNKPRFYGPDFLLIKDIVLVTINYRLGALGFLSVSDSEISGNMGLKDQNLALKWVQRNIKSFNGDPGNVTIFGESAGSASVHAHVLSPASKGLFHRAILQSGCIFNHWFWGTKNRAKELTKHLGKTAKTEREALEILQEVSGLEVFNAQEQIPDILSPSIERPFGAVIEEQNDGAFFSKTPHEIIKKGEYNQVSLMVGYTETEGLLRDFVEKSWGPMPPYGMEDLVPFELGVTKGSDDSKRIAAMLEKLYSSKSKESLPNEITDSWFLAEITQALLAHLKTAKNPIYLYRMSIVTQLNLFKTLMGTLDEPGVSHADDLGYLWRSDLTPEIKPGSIEDKFLRIFVELWTNFAEFGNPTPNNSAVNIIWPPLTSQAKFTLLDIGKNLVVKDDLPERERMQVWNDIYSQYGKRLWK